MAEPPKTPPSSDLQGVNRDSRIGSPDEDHPNPAGAIKHAKDESSARPDESEPDDGEGGA